MVNRRIFQYIDMGILVDFLNDMIVDSGITDEFSQTFSACPNTFAVDEDGNLNMEWPVIDYSAFNENQGLMKKKGSISFPLLINK